VAANNESVSFFCYETWLRYLSIVDVLHMWGGFAQSEREISVKRWNVEETDL